jgi:hypothetical protein
MTRLVRAKFSAEATFPAEMAPAVPEEPVGGVEVDAVALGALPAENTLPANATGPPKKTIRELSTAESDARNPETAGGSMCARAAMMDLDAKTRNAEKTVQFSARTLCSSSCSW